MARNARWQRKPALKARPYRVERRVGDPPRRAASVGASTWAPSTRSPTRRAASGKTTTAVNVAACIAEAGYETLLVDVDPQANATVGLGADRTDGARPLRRPERRRRPPTRPSARPTSSACRCCRRRPTSPARRSSCRACRAPRRRLRDALAPLRDRFAFMLLDCPPSLGPLTVNALVAADRVIVPVQTEYFALEGLAGLLDTLVADPARAEPAPDRRRACC